MVWYNTLIAADATRTCLSVSRSIFHTFKNKSPTFFHSFPWGGYSSTLERAIHHFPAENHGLGGADPLDHFTFGLKPTSVFNLNMVYINIASGVNTRHVTSKLNVPCGGQKKPLSRPLWIIWTTLVWAQKGMHLICLNIEFPSTYHFLHHRITGWHFKTHLIVLVIWCDLFIAFPFCLFDLHDDISPSAELLPHETVKHHTRGAFASAPPRTAGGRRRSQ